MVVLSRMRGGMSDGSEWGMPVMELHGGGGRERGRELLDSGVGRMRSGWGGE